MSEPLDPEENVLEDKPEEGFYIVTRPIRPFPVLSDEEHLRCIAAMSPGLPPSCFQRSRKYIMNIELRQRIEQAINECSAESNSNTPDFILAQYLIDCLAAFDKAVLARDAYYDTDDDPNSDYELPTVDEMAGGWADNEPGILAAGALADAGLLRNDEVIEDQRIKDETN